jgi:hypothetical protein
MIQNLGHTLIKKQVQDVMTQDNVPLDEQEVILDLITKCYFKKRQSVSTDYRWLGFLNFLCAADLAEGVGPESLQ